jgi:CelD/BcsL family acetyltransferase involved in cellulose biosynthesis
LRIPIWRGRWRLARMRGWIDSYGSGFVVNGASCMPICSQAVPGLEKIGWRRNVVPHSRSDDQGGTTVADPAPAESRRLQVEVVTDYRRFIDLEQIWNQLVDDAGMVFPFVRHEWIRALWDSFDHGGDLHVLVVKEGGRPIAIAPLMRDRGRMYGIPVRRLRGIANIYTERFDFIVSMRPDECGTAIWTYLAEHASEWDVLELRQVTLGSWVLDHPPPWDIAQRFLIAEWLSTESPYIPVSQSWEAYFKSLKKGHRANIRKCVQHLEASAPVGVDVVVSNVNLDADIDDALTLEAVAWKDQGGTAIRSRHDTAAFYRQVLHKAAERHWLRLYFLTVGGKRIAVRMALLFRNRVYMLKSGYDPQYAAFSPGHLLCHKMLEEAWRLHFDEVDFLGSAEQWKLNWSKGLRRHFWLFAFPKRLKPRLLHFLKFSLVPRIRRSRLYAPLRRAAAGMDVTIQEQ